MLFRSQAYLDGLSRSELHELVLTLAEYSETVRRTLEAVADLAGDRRGAAGEDPVRRAASRLSFISLSIFLRFSLAAVSSSTINTFMAYTMLV